MITNQLMSKFFSKVKWMKAYIQTKVNKFLQLLYIQILSWNHLAIYINYPALFFSYLTSRSNELYNFVVLQSKKYSDL